MRQGLFWRIGLTACILLVSVAFFLPTLLHPPHEAKKTETGFLDHILPNTRVNLGLDLMGGIHLTLGVDVEKAVQTAVLQMGQALVKTANDKGMLTTRPRVAQGDKLEFMLAAPQRKADFEELLAKDYSDLHAASAQALPDGKIRYLLELTSAARARLDGNVVDQALKTIRNRIDQFGVAEPDVRKQQGSDRIIIQLPGMDDAQRAVDIIGKTAHLEFRLVRDDVDPNARVLPPGVERLPMDYTTREGQRVETSLPVDAQAVMTGEHISNAIPHQGQDGQYQVSLSFDRLGEEQFGRVTRDNVGRRLAIVLDGKIHSAPVIQTEIRGTASITGNFTLTEANDLSIVLRAGSLPAPVVVLEQRSVGPSLGQESIDMGITATLAGGALVVVFMLIYYGMSGAIADVMLLLDVVLILAGMALFGATLTLPGIAGIVLTLGMAVDANVLIFERIREELKKGLTPVAAIDAGFSRAMLAITDSNLTTIIAAVILYQFGTGPVRGFAVTLTLGILASMFTAIFVSRIVFDLWMSKPGRKLSI